MNWICEQRIEIEKLIDYTKEQREGLFDFQLDSCLEPLDCGPNYNFIISHKENIQNKIIWREAAHIYVQHFSLQVMFFLNILSFSRKNFKKCQRKYFASFSFLSFSCILFFNKILKMFFLN